MKQLAVIFILLISNLAHSQSFEIVLGDSTQNCTAKSIVTMGSKVSILVSCTSSGGTYNNFIYQYDSMGQYINSFELPVNELIVERMVLSGNNFLVCGSVYDSTGDAQAFLMMADTNYNILWEKRFGALSTDESFNGVCTLPDKSITGCGYTQNPSGSGNAIYAVKTDSSGNFIWEQFYTSAFSSTADQILSLNDGTLVISGDRSSSSGLFNNVTMRIDSSSSLIWEHESLNPYNNGCKNDLYTSDGNVLVVGESATATSPFFDPLIIKVDSSGNERWLYIYPGVPGSTDVLFAICEVNSDRFIAAGYGINPFTGSSDIILMEIDSAGTEKYRTYIGDSTSTESPSAIITDSDNQGIYICGSTFRNNKIRAYFIYRSLSSLQSVNEENVSQRIVAYPNPSQRKIQFSGMYIDNVPASIFNAMGKLIFNSVIQNNELDLGDFENGIYIIRITLDQNTYTFRVSVIH